MLKTSEKPHGFRLFNACDFSPIGLKKISPKIHRNVVDFISLLWYNKTIEGSVFNEDPFPLVRRKTDYTNRYFSCKIVGTAVMESVTPLPDEQKLQFATLLNVPADCTINQAGIVATSDAEKGKNLTAENADYVRADATTKHGYRYTWTKTKVTADQTWYVRPYLVYTNANGKEFTVYGDLSTGKIN